MIAGADAAKKAQRTGEALFERTRAMLAAHGLAEYSETRIEVLGGRQSFAPGSPASTSLEVVLKLSAKHRDRRALELFAREFAPAATSMAPGTMALVPGRPTPSPLVRCFSCLVPKIEVPVRVVSALTPAEGELVSLRTSGGFVRSASERLLPACTPAVPLPDGPTVRVPLLRLCWGRSGDKGDTANIGLIARRGEYLPWLTSVVTEEAVAAWFAYDVEGDVTRFELPGLNAINFVMTHALGGGGTSSLRTDSLAKAFAQRLLCMEVDAPAEWFADEGPGNTD